MKKFFSALLCALLLLGIACAEGCLPEGAQLLAEEGDERRYRVEETGEELILSMQGESASGLRGEFAGAIDASWQEQSREGAEVALREEYPAARVLRAKETQLAGLSAWKLTFVCEEAAGWATLLGDRIREREVSFGAYFQEGRLTMTGARTVVLLYRPQAQLTEIELDEDDGLWIYEGEAILDGTEYEFEIHAETAQLLEWERD